MKSVIFLSNNDWWYHNPTSTIQIARELAKDCNVLFVNSISFGAPSRKESDFAAKIIRKLKSYIRFYRKVGENLHVLSPFSIPSFGNPIISAFNQILIKGQIAFGIRLAEIEQPVCIVANPMFHNVGLSSFCSKIIYFVTDKYDEKKLPNKAAVICADKKLAENADVIVCVSWALFEHYKKDHSDVKVITHGVNHEHFSADNKKSLSCPGEIIKSRNPIVGFMGVVDEKTSDPELLEYLFEQNTNKNFIFVGTLSEKLNYLAQYTNAYFLGQKDFSALPAYLSQFDVALMPFNNSGWIKYCNPIKFKEYLAAGLPVVSINIREAEQYRDIVYMASTYEEFNDLLNVAIKEDSAELKRIRKERVSKETWTEKVKLIKALF